MANMTDKEEEPLLVEICQNTVLCTNNKINERRTLAGQGQKEWLTSTVTRYEEAVGGKDLRKVGHQVSSVGSGCFFCAFPVWEVILLGFQFLRLCWFGF